MPKKHPIIEMNGKRYDANTGVLIGSNSAQTIASPGALNFSQRQPAVTNFLAARPAAAPAPPPRQIAVMDIKPHTGRRPATAPHHVQAHRPEPARTLTRSAVKRPGLPLKRTAHVQPATDLLAKKVHGALAGPKPQIGSIDSTRLARASQISHHQLISRFGSSQDSADVPNLPAPIAPAAAPIHRPPVAKAAASAPAKSSNHAPVDIFEQALARASSHEQAPVKPKKHLLRHAKRRSTLRRRLAGVSATVAAILLIGGFIAYQNKDNLVMQLASSKAGFHANLPGYKPSGFAVSNFSYSPGLVAVNFKNDQANRSYTLIQKASSWDSSTLRSDFVAANDSSYQTFKVAGRTIYIYGDHNATWVNGGVQYEVSSHGNLSTDQLVRISSST